MSYLNGERDTICALSTPEGEGGIAVIRVSGKDSLSLTRKVCPFLPLNIKTHTIHYGKLISHSSSEPIDEVLVSYFKEGSSFTGEETLEISCHGSRQIVLSVLNELVKMGCRIAQRGEFTFRSFMNGKMDLVQAESVLDLIKSQSPAAHRVALMHLKGTLSQKYREIEEAIVLVCSHLEASIDFSHEDIEPLNLTEIQGRLEQISQVCTELIDSYQRGKRLKHGCQVAIVGPPNVGKSSLMNALTKSERSIVTDIPGTTRDLVESEFHVSGLSVKLIDTAGLHSSEDPIEKIGMSRAVDVVSSLEHVIVVLDINDVFDVQIQPFLNELKSKSILFVLNKSDLLRNDLNDYEIDRRLKEIGFDKSIWVKASTLTKEGLARIEEQVGQWSRAVEEVSPLVVTQSRHVELLQKINAGVVKASRLLGDNTSPEVVVFELQDAIRGIHDLLGKEYSEQILDKIFKEFCIGK